MELHDENSYLNGFEGANDDLDGARGIFFGVFWGAVAFVVAVAATFAFLVA